MSVGSLDGSRREFWREDLSHGNVDLVTSALGVSTRTTYALHHESIDSSLFEDIEESRQKVLSTEMLMAFPLSGAAQCSLFAFLPVRDCGEHAG